MCARFHFSLWLPNAPICLATLPRNCLMGISQWIHRSQDFWPWVCQWRRWSGWGSIICSRDWPFMLISDKRPHIPRSDTLKSTPPGSIWFPSPANLWRSCSCRNQMPLETDGLYPGVCMAHLRPWRRAHHRNTDKCQQIRKHILQGISPVPTVLRSFP